MEAVVETTNWSYPNHTYLLDGTNLVAYIPTGGRPVYFKHPIKQFDRRGRTFKRADIKLFRAVKSNLIEVTGSKGNTYFVDPEARTCTCTGFTYHGKCKHLATIPEVL